VQCDIANPEGSNVRMLIRGEIDAVTQTRMSIFHPFFLFISHFLPIVETPKKKTYKLHKKTEGNLHVYTTVPPEVLTIGHLREIKMAV
jgi:hypothetical protein